MLAAKKFGEFSANSLERVGAAIIQTIDGFGQFARFTNATIVWSVRHVGGLRRFRLLATELYTVGTTSIPVVLMVGTFVGAVLGVEMFDQFAALGQEATLGGVIDLSVVKQIGPVLAAVMIAGRVGGAVSAEIGTMRVTEQIDAMRVMGTDPIAYLVVPRVIACILMLPILTIFSDLAGVLGGWVVVVKGFQVDAAEYWKFSAHFVESWDVLIGLIKSVVFGGAIGLISCYKGFHCSSGARGVGRAATESFVVSFLAIIVANFFLAAFLKSVYVLLFGGGIDATLIS